MNVSEESAGSASAVDPLLGWIPQSGRWAPSLRYLLRRDRILRALTASAGQRLLEVGCGGGTLLVELSRRGWDCTGLETSAEAFALAHELIREAGSVVRLEHTPQPSWTSRFDVICAFDVMEHIEDDAAAMRLWISWLKPGGALLLTVPAHAARWNAGDVWAGHHRRYERAQLQNIVEDQGMRIEHLECYGFPLANITELFGAPYYRRELARRKDTNRESGNRLSGIDRTVYRRVLPILDSIAGRAALWCALKAQAATAHTDLGSGYLIAARKS